MSHIPLTIPAFEPVTLDDAKSFLRVDGTDNDSTIQALITASRLHVERVTSRVLINQSWRIYADKLPQDGVLKFRIGPVTEILSIIIFDGNGEPTALDTHDYLLDIAASPGRLKFRKCIKPMQAINGIEVDVVAGYGASPYDVPADLRQAILMLIAHWYENRSAVVNGMSSFDTPIGVKPLIQPYRVVSL